MANVADTAPKPTVLQSANPVTDAFLNDPSNTEYVSLDGVTPCATRAIMVPSDGAYYFQFSDSDAIVLDPLTLKAGIIYPFSIIKIGSSSVGSVWCFV